MRAGQVARNPELPVGIAISVSWRYTEIVPESFHGAIAADNFLDLMRQIENGLRYSVLEDLAAATGLRTADIATITGIRKRTLARRKSDGRLAPDESERLVRFSRIFRSATELFDGDQQAAIRWLNSPHKALGGKPAMSYLASEAGAREVEHLIGRLEHGVFS